MTSWNCYDLAMSDSLRGVGYGRRCIARLIEELRNTKQRQKKSDQFRVHIAYAPDDYQMNYSLSSVVGLYQELGFVPEIGQDSRYYHPA